MHRLDARDRFVSLFSCIVLLVALVPARLSSAQDAQSAKTFLASIYRHYEHGGKGISIDGPNADRYFASSLLALVRADAKAAGPEYVGAIDADPVCACQDWEGIWDLSIDVKGQSPNHLDADVSFSLSPPQNHSKDALRRLHFKLIVERGGWKMDDITDLSDPKAPFALRKALVDDIALNRPTARAKH